MINLKLSIQEKLQQISINERTAYALVILFSILCVDGFFRLNDIVIQKQQRMRVAERLASRSAENIDQTLWQERVNQTTLSKTEWEGQYWKGSTEGVIRAEIQKTINTTLENININRPRANVEPALTEWITGDIYRYDISARSASQAQFIELLLTLSTQKPLLFTDDLSLRFRTDGQMSFNIKGFAPVQLINPSSVNETNNQDDPNTESTRQSNPNAE